MATRLLDWPQGRFELDVPSQARVWDMAPAPAPPLNDPAAGLELILNGNEALGLLAAPVSNGARVLLICDDDTRPTPPHLLLPGLIRKLESWGCRRDDLELLIACGLHKPTSLEALGRKVGDYALANCTVLQHDAGDNKSMQHFGHASLGTPVYLNKRLEWADLVIGLGNISLSKEAGYGGGGKIVLPGVAGVETIHATHSRVKDHPNQVARLGGNPIRLEIEEAASMSGLDYLINTVLNQDEGIFALACGEPAVAFQRGIELFNRVYGVELPEPLDLILAGSSPMDQDLYQANKAFGVSSLGLRDKGYLAVTAPCPGGISSFEYFDRMITSGRDFNYWKDYLARPESEHIVAAEMILGLRYLVDVRGLRLGLDSPGITPKECRAMGICPLTCLQEAVDKAAAELGPDLKLGQAPKGPLTLMRIKGSRVGRVSPILKTANS